VPSVQRWKAHAAADAQVLDGFFALAQAQASAGCVLPGDVRHHGGGQHLLGDGQRVREASPFHVREVELAQQQDARGVVQRRAVREAALGVLGARDRGAREGGLAQQKLRRHLGGAGGGLLRHSAGI
jgi:hypothetical protein